MEEEKKKEMKCAESVYIIYCGVFLFECTEFSEGSSSLFLPSVLATRATGAWCIDRFSLRSCLGALLSWSYSSRARLSIYFVRPLRCFGEVSVTCCVLGRPLVSTIHDDTPQPVAEMVYMQ